MKREVVIALQQTFNIKFSFIAATTAATPTTTSILLIIAVQQQQNSCDRSLSTITNKQRLYVCYERILY